jgi:hypothetical protein
VIGGRLTELTGGVGVFGGFFTFSSKWTPTSYFTLATVQEEAKKMGLHTLLATVIQRDSSKYKMFHRSSKWKQVVDFYNPNSGNRVYMFMSKVTPSPVVTKRPASGIYFANCCGVLWGTLQSCETEYYGCVVRIGPKGARKPYTTIRSLGDTYSLLVAKTPMGRRNGGRN